mmetsp:Transcript_68267/g.188918  ORF Transcript_68267/g.188918 Transcript_68267/m.188918 type:complete len:519 (-) Transcript_68267:86-1642(-)
MEAAWIRRGNEPSSHEMTDAGTESEEAGSMLGTRSRRTVSVRASELPTSSCTLLSCSLVGVCGMAAAGLAAAVLCLSSGAAGQAHASPARGRRELQVDSPPGHGERLGPGHHIQNPLTGKCLDWSKIYITAMQCDPSARTQRWHYLDSHRFQTLEGQCLDNGGELVHRWTCVESGFVSRHQVWGYEPHDKGQIRSEQNFCLTTNRSSDLVLLRRCIVGEDDQKWAFQDVDSPKVANMQPWWQGTAHPSTTTSSARAGPWWQQQPQQQPHQPRPQGTEPSPSHPVAEPPSTVEHEDIPCPVDCFNQPCTADCNQPEEFNLEASGKDDGANAERAPASDLEEARGGDDGAHPPRKRARGLEPVQIRHRSGVCLDSHGSVRVQACSSSDLHQLWRLDPVTSWVVNLNGSCLDAGTPTMLGRCNASNTNQAKTTDRPCLEVFGFTAVSMRDCDLGSAVPQWSMVSFQPPTSGVQLLRSLLVASVAFLVVLVAAVAILALLLTRCRNKPQEAKSNTFVTVHHV